MRQIDTKYQTSGEITKNDGTPLPADEPLVLFRGKDAVLPKLLEEYKRLCTEAGSPAQHVAAIDGQIARIKDWQAAHPEVTKRPD